MTFLEVILPTIHVVTADDTLHAAALEIFRRLAPRRRLSYVDALSFVVVRQSLDDMPCLAFDRDFKGLGLTVLA